VVFNLKITFLLCSDVKQTDLFSSCKMIEEKTMRLYFSGLMWVGAEIHSSVASLLLTEEYSAEKLEIGDCD